MISTTFCLAMLAVALIFFALALFTSVEEPPVCYVFRASLAFVSSAITWVITALTAFGQVGSMNYQVVSQTVSGSTTALTYEVMELPLGAEATYLLALIALGLTAFMTLQIIALTRSTIKGLNQTGEEEGEEE